MDKRTILIVAGESGIAGCPKSRGWNHATRARFDIGLRAILFISVLATALLISGCTATEDDIFVQGSDTHKDAQARDARENQDEDVTAEKPGANLDQANMN